MVVSSESMEPAFRRGDVILLWNREPGIFTGDIPVIWFSGGPLPMVHQAIQVVNDGSVSGYYTYLLWDTILVTDNRLDASY
jgi:signal peptidase